MASALAKQVMACNKRSREHGLPGTLTMLDWQRSLAFFDHTCAYCGSTGPLTIDHFQPLACGGGSTHSNCVPSCPSCNVWKASTPLDKLPPSFLTSPRFLAIQNYLEAIGTSNQQHWHRLSAREPRFAQMDAAVAHLKTFCETQISLPFTDHDAYDTLRRMLFGVPWDPEHYFQVTVSLSWQQQHSTLTTMRTACENAWHILRTHVDPFPA